MRVPQLYHHFSLEYNPYAWGMGLRDPENWTEIKRGFLNDDNTGYYGSIDANHWSRPINVKGSESMHNGNANKEDNEKTLKRCDAG